MPASLISRLLKAKIGLQCRAGLMRTLSAFHNLRPWALKLFDASGKLPTGLFQGSRADLGAFDECLELVVRDDQGNQVTRGQYCNVLVYNNNATAAERTIESFSSVLHPKLLQFKSYFTVEEIAIVRIGICFIEECTQADLQSIIDTGALLELAAAFSITSNTRELKKVTNKVSEEECNLQFLHGVRFFCIVHVALGHFHTTLSDTWARPLSYFVACGNWPSMITAAGFNSVGTFFFLRTCIPLFFVVMCLYLVPRFVIGPDTKAYFRDFYGDVGAPLVAVSPPDQKFLRDHYFGKPRGCQPSARCIVMRQTRMDE
ncbi:hypothetical protein MTO96_019766 [Rhipicephalus appendiculatus]